MDFGWLLGAFWEPTRHPKFDTILDGFWDARKAVVRIFAGRPGGMRGVPGGIKGGYKDAKIAGETRTRALGIPDWYLARRPWWGGGSLRAFRRAEVVLRGCIV